MRWTSEGSVDGINSNGTCPSYLWSMTADMLWLTSFYIHGFVLGIRTGCCVHNLFLSQNRVMHITHTNRLCTACGLFYIKGVIVDMLMNCTEVVGERVYRPLGPTVEVPVLIRVGCHGLGIPDWSLWPLGKPVRPRAKLAAEPADWQ